MPFSNLFWPCPFCVVSPRSWNCPFCCSYKNVLVSSGREGLYLNHRRLNLLVILSPGTHTGRVPFVLRNNGSKSCIPVVGMRGRAWVAWSFSYVLFSYWFLSMYMLCVHVCMHVHMLYMHVGLCEGRGRVCMHLGPCVYECSRLTLGSVLHHASTIHWGLCIHLAFMWALEIRAEVLAWVRRFSNRWAISFSTVTFLKGVASVVWIPCEDTVSESMPRVEQCVSHHPGMGFLGKQERSPVWTNLCGVSSLSPESPRLPLEPLHWPFFSSLLVFWFSSFSSLQILSLGVDYIFSIIIILAIRFPSTRRTYHISLGF